MIFKYWGISKYQVVLGCLIKIYFIVGKMIFFRKEGFFLMIIIFLVLFYLWILFIQVFRGLSVVYVVFVEGRYFFLVEIMCGGYREGRLSKLFVQERVFSFLGLWFFEGILYSLFIFFRKIYSYIKCCLEFQWLQVFVFYYLI